MDLEIKAEDLGAKQMGGVMRGKSTGFKGVAIVLALLGGIAVSAAMAENHWTCTSQATEQYKNLSANGITGPVGYLDSHSATAGVSVGEYGTQIAGTIEAETGNDHKLQDNTLSQAWKYGLDQDHDPFTSEVELKQDPSGSGLSLTQPGGDLASSYVSKIHDITFEPSGGTTTMTAKLSLYYQLNNSDSYIVAESVSYWKREIDVPKDEKNLKVTVLTRAESVVGGKLVTVSDGGSAKSSVKLLLTLTVPRPPDDE